MNITNVIQLTDSSSSFWTVVFQDIISGVFILLVSALSTMVICKHNEMEKLRDFVFKRNKICSTVYEKDDYDKVWNAESDRIAKDKIENKYVNERRSWMRWWYCVRYLFA